MSVEESVSYGSPPSAPELVSIVVVQSLAKLCTEEGEVKTQLHSGSSRSCWMILFLTGIKVDLLNPTPRWELALRIRHMDRDLGLGSKECTATMKSSNAKRS